MIPSDVWTNLVSTLKNNPTLSKYIRNVYEGFRYNIEPNSLPCLMIEPTSNNEVQKDLNQYKDIFLNLDIFAVSTADYNRADKTIVGDTDYKGILDIENDIRACLQSSYSLGDTVLDIRFDPTTFDVGEIGKHPVRGLRMPIKVLYRQNNGA